MRCRTLCGCLLAAIVFLAAPVLGDSVALTVHTDQATKSIDKRIYGQFLEHIFNSVHGGLWGDQILNGTLELRTRARPWEQSADGVLTLAPVAKGNEIPMAPLFLGNAKWGDYEYSLEARKRSGEGGITIYVRATDTHRGYAVTLGASGNKEHALRRLGGNEAFWGPPEAVKAGSLENDKWYRVRVRCEGAKVTVFLDNEQILEWTDPATGNNAYATGRVGIDAPNAAAEYRNLSVRPLAGGEVALMSPLPAAALAVAPFGWEFFGDARFSNDAESRVNSDVSLRISRLSTTRTNAAAPPSGIRQGNLAFKAGEEYTLALYARGTPQSGVFVNIADGQGAIYMKELADLTGEWRKQTLTFTPARSSDAASLSISLVGSGDIHIDQISLFSAAALATGGYRPDLFKAVSDLKPATIRWPGGSFANYYLWQNGIGPREQRISHPVEQWGDRDPNQFGTDEFLQMCEKMGAEPILVINTSRGVDDALHWLEYCMGDAGTEYGKMRAANGHAAPYALRTIEIDNEAWLMMRYPQYEEIVKKFCPAIRAKFPQVQLSVCGGYAFDDGPGEGVPENANWDQRILNAAAKDFDVLSPHYYNGLLKEHAPDFKEDPRKYEAFLKGRGAMIAKSANPNLKIYVSEWNLTHKEWGNDWRVGLYAGGILNAFERQADVVSLSCPALFMRKIGVTQSWDNALINFDQKGWFPAANYVVMKLWREAYAPNLLGVEGPDHPLNFVASRSEDQRTVYLKVVNPEAAACEAAVSLEGAFVPRSAAMEVIAPGSETAKNSLLTPDQIKVVTGTAAVEGKMVKFNMPALSAAVVRVMQ